MGTSRSKLILMVGVLGISASAILVRFSRAPSGVLAVYRLGWTVLLLLPVVLLRYRSELKRVTGRDVLLCAASGICLAIHFLAWFESLRLTSVSVSTVLVSTEVIFTALGFALFLRGRIPRLGVAAILLAFGGSAVLALSGGAEAGALSGNLLALAAAVASALYTLIGRVQRGHLSTTVYTFLTYLACFVTLVVLTAGSGTPLTGYALGKRAAPVEGTAHSTSLTGYVLGHILRLTLTPVRRRKYAPSPVARHRRTLRRPRGCY